MALPIRNFLKITHGWVTQTYKDNKCVEQSFFAGDQVEYEDDKGNALNADEVSHSEPGSETYQSFDMAQPTKD